MTHPNTKKALRSALLTIVLILCFIILKSLTNSEIVGVKVFSVVSGILILLIFFMTITGFIFALKTKNEPKTKLKIMALVLNSILMALLVVSVINIGIELVRYLK
jgi:ABC-type transport system involved in cytochrome c biogenesis permease subunit